MPRNVLAVLLAVALGALAACERKAAETPFFPLDRGRTWTYVVTTDPGDGSEPLVLKVESLGAEDLGGRRVTREKIDLAGETHFRFTASDERGVYRYATQSAGEAAPILDSVRDDLLVLPPARAATWKGETGFSFLDGPDKVAIESVLDSTNDVVDVPAGRFADCIRVDTRGSARGDDDATYALTEQVWYASGVGLVKSVAAETVSGPVPQRIRVTTELVAYTR